MERRDRRAILLNIAPVFKCVQRTNLSGLKLRGLLAVRHGGRGYGRGRGCSREVSNNSSRALGSYGGRRGMTKGRKDRFFCRFGGSQGELKSNGSMIKSVGGRSGAGCEWEGLAGARCELAVK